MVCRTGVVPKNYLSQIPVAPPPLRLCHHLKRLTFKNAYRKFVHSPWLLTFCGSVSHELVQTHQGRRMVIVGTGWLSPWVPEAAPITCPPGPRTRRGLG
jgi:hypothetical protein